MSLAPRARIGAFEILAFLGAGGMGEVYRARDTRLEREIALKVLPPETLTDDTAQARLFREARLASQLNHPHICTIHEVGEADGRVYIAMELVEGQPLAARVAGGPLPIEQVRRYGMQVADALAHAHERGIVHRDLKTANVAVTLDGQAKVLDFGLARRLSADAIEQASTIAPASLTSPGTLVGTLAYMAPEQLRGESADARSDIWALGVVLYEMASGRRPFLAQTSYALSSAILNDAPPALPSGVPAAIAAVIERCLDKEPGQRFQRAGEVRAALETVQSGRRMPFRTPRLRPALHRRWPALAVAATVLVAALVVLDVGGLREGFPGRSARLGLRSLAVLPLANLSGDPAQEYLADGIQEALITDLARLHGFQRVIARSSVLRYRKTDKSTRQIAQELGVDALITGSVLRSGERVRITAQLVRAATDNQIWADRYDREFRDILALENEIVSAITREVRLQLTPQERELLAAARQEDPQAFENYLKGWFHLQKLSQDELNTAQRYFELALETDPGYAAAHVGLANVWMMRGDAGFLPPTETLPRARAAVSKALRLDDASAEAHTALGTLKTFEWDWPGAETEFRRALELNPNYAYAHFAYADLLITMRRPAEWSTEIHRTLELDPLNFFWQAFYGWHLIYEGRNDEAIAACRKVLAVEPDFSSARMGLWGALYKKGDHAGAFDEAKSFFAALGDREVIDALDRGWAATGYRGAMKLAGEKLAARAARSHVSSVRIARLFAHAGERERALDWLERAYERRESPMIHLGVGWDWDELKPEPRYQSLLRRMNLPQG